MTHKDDKAGHTVPTPVQPFNAQDTTKTAQHIKITKLATHRWIIVYSVDGVEQVRAADGQCEDLLVGVVYKVGRELVAVHKHCNWNVICSLQLGKATVSPLQQQLVIVG